MNFIAVIGAGLSGLTIAHTLKNQANITIFEKSMGVGGRMATRRADPFHFDHGAQFFIVKTETFQTFIDPMIEQGVIQHWAARFAEFENKEIVAQRNWDQHYPHYVGAPGMNAIGKYLSNGLNIHLNTRVGSIQKDADHWSLFDDQSKHLGNFDWVISTVPAKQASELLSKAFTYHSQIKSVKMKGCFSLMLGFETPLALEFDAALVRGRDISWISVNSSKPGRDEAFCLLIHSTNKWADEHIEDDRNEVLEYLCSETSRTISHDVTKATHKAIHGWRYANIEKQEDPSYFIDIDQKLGACGDWCIQGRIEAAFTSGLGLAKKILKNI